MRRNLPLTALLISAALTASAATGLASFTALPASAQALPKSDPTSFSRSWSQTVTDGVDISTASPVVVPNGNSPFVVVGDLGGNLRAYDLKTGKPRPGWGAINVGYEIKAPLSTDGTNVYVPVAQDYKDNRPDFRKYGPDGKLVWRTAQTKPQPPGVGFLLAGMPLATVDGRLKVFGMSSGHWFYGFDAADGREDWAFRNADSTMATPVLADVYGLGAPQLLLSNDKTAEFPPRDKNGGHIRIFTAQGRQVCSADQPTEGGVHAYSGYNNSSPAIAEIGGRPLVVFGSTGPIQYGDGGNQVVAYDIGCNRVWSSPPLAAQVQVSLVFADVLGRGTPQVLAAVGVPDGDHQYPRVYVLDPANGRILVDSGASLRGFGGQLTYPPGISLATADVNGDGRQDLFVPANDILVLDGPTLGVIDRVPLLGGAIQNTPVITAEPGGGLRVTYSGYTGNAGPKGHAGLIRSYVSRTGRLGTIGWPRFGQNSQLTGLQGRIQGPYDQIIESQSLQPGQSLRAGRARATMQADGNFVVRGPTGRVMFATHTRVRGSRLYLDGVGRLQVRAPDKRVLWEGGHARNGLSRFVLGTDGRIYLTAGTWNDTGSERTMRTVLVWAR